APGGGAGGNHDPDGEPARPPPRSLRWPSVEYAEEAAGTNIGEPGRGLEQAGARLPGEGDDLGLADQVLCGDEADAGGPLDTAVDGVVAVVAHHEVVTGGDFVD